MKYPILAVSLALLGAAACQQKSAEAPAAENAAAPAEGFEFTVRKSGLEMAFKGARGTQWRELKHSCAAVPCEFVLDSTGVNTDRPVAGFGIAFSVGEKSVDMMSAAGASWLTLNYACEGEQCSFKVDDKGVAGI
ncbi:MAG: hypothetical protein RDU13_07435 [Elusimicrobiales bacterium]|jgi:hypothetical protein|nr:hypothetical protein [Elusimicrobiales bacterium]